MTVAAAILASPNVPAGSGTSYSLAASLSPTSLSQSGSTPSITTATCTCTATGGTAPYSYHWIVDDGSDGVTATAPASATTAFKINSSAPGNTYLGSFFCVVTDALSSTVSTGDVFITITRT